MLARKFSGVWIAENARDLLGQANVEYAEWLKDNPPADNPVGWLLTCAYRRAANLLDSECRRPPAASLDAVFQLADERTPTPEEQALDDDRQTRLRKAVAQLPPKEARLLALVYFEDHSIREAGRKLGWQKSAADRHHHAALKRLRVLIGDRNLLSPASLGLGAWAIAHGEGRALWRAPIDASLDLARGALAGGGETLSMAAHRAADLLRRAMPFSEPGNALATSGAGRAAGYCGAALGAAVCGLAATGVVGPGVKVGTGEQARPAKVRQAERAAQRFQPRDPRPQPSEAGSSGDATAGASGEGASRQRQFAPQATTQDTVEEFGVESGGGGGGAPVEESSSGSSSSQPAPAPRSPNSAATSEFGL